MIAHAILSFDKNYYAQYFSDWMRTRSKFRKFAPAIAVLIIASGSMVLVQADHLRVGLGSIPIQGLLLGK